MRIGQIINDKIEGMGIIVDIYVRYVKHNPIMICVADFGNGRMVDRPEDEIELIERCTI